MKKEYLPFVSNSVIALVMLATFASLSHGLSLIVTFIPGVIFSYLVCLYLIWAKIDLSAKKHLFSLFLISLAVQFLHFAEEYSTGFNSLFPKLYNGDIYSLKSFVTINMVSYTLFLLSALSVFKLKSQIVLMPFLFFVVYGVCGNAIAHSYWSLEVASYFPGLFTSFIYWVLGPLLINSILGQNKFTVVLLSSFTLVLIPLLKIFMS